jgi:hypothetical protein
MRRREKTAEPSTDDRSAHTESETPVPEEISGMPKISPPPKNRLTVVETVYHQVSGEQPQSVESRFDRELQSDEQMYQRCKVATEEWQPLDLGWVPDPGTIVIENNEGILQQVNPTPEQQEELAKKILVLSQDSGLGFEVRPGESFRFSHDAPGVLLLRCRSGSARYRISVIPS